MAQEEQWEVTINDFGTLPHFFLYVQVFQISVSFPYKWVFVIKVKKANIITLIKTKK